MDEASKAAVSIYDQHQRAVLEWQEACRDFRRAEQRREQARAAVEKMTSSLSQHVARAMEDPTVPQAPQQYEEPLNGAQLGIGRSRF
jgi:hypothetical protein